VTAPNRICLVVDVLRRMLRTQDKSFDIGMAKMEYARFAMIYPNDGMVVVRTHYVCLCWPPLKYWRSSFQDVQK